MTNLHLFFDPEYLQNFFKGFLTVDSLDDMSTNEEMMIRFMIKFAQSQCHDIDLESAMNHLTIEFDAHDMDTSTLEDDFNYYWSQL